MAVSAGRRGQGRRLSADSVGPLAGFLLAVSGCFVLSGLPLQPRGGWRCDGHWCAADFQPFRLVALCRVGKGGPLIRDGPRTGV